MKGKNLIPSPSKGEGKGEGEGEDEDGIPLLIRRHREATLQTCGPVSFTHLNELGRLRLWQAL